MHTHPIICYIHGLNSTHRSFSYIGTKLGACEIKLIDYDSHQPLQDSIQQVMKQLPKNRALILVGHSLGGVIALNIAHQVPVLRVITISSPLGGSRAATFLRWFSSVSVVGDITPTSKAIVRLQAPVPCPVLSIISTGGHLPTSQEPNDSVVTISSQRAIKEAKKVEIKANHFEILMHDKTAEVISKFITECDG